MTRTVAQYVLILVAGVAIGASFALLHWPENTGIAIVIFAIAIYIRHLIRRRICPDEDGTVSLEEVRRHVDERYGQTFTLDGALKYVDEVTAKANESMKLKTAPVGSSQRTLGQPERDRLLISGPREYSVTIPVTLTDEGAKEYKKLAEPTWEVVSDSDGVMHHVRWSKPNDRGEYFMCAHYPEKWRAQSQADGWNREGKSPYEFREFARTETPSKQLDGSEFD